MLHCGRGRRRAAAAAAATVLAMLATSGFGCARKAETPPNVAAQTPEKQPEEKKPEPLPLAGTVRGGAITLFDEKGVVVAQVKARAGAVGQKSGHDRSGGVAGLLYKGKATLHEKGRLVATLTAEEVTADEKTHVVTGKGNVVARSLTEPGSPTVRADTMTWRPDRNESRGSGNVRMTRGDRLHRPGKAFVADTRIRRIRMTAGSSPATLKF